MIVNVTNNTAIQIAFPAVKGNGPVLFPAGATTSNVTMDDIRRFDLQSLVNSGQISVTYVQLPNIPAVDPQIPGRTVIALNAYTLQQSDLGAVVEFESSSPSVITLPATLSRGFSCQILRYGSGAVTWAGGSGATLRVPGAQVGAKAQYSVFSVYVRDNVGGSAAEYVISGDIA